MGIEQRLQQRVRASKFADDSDEDEEYFSPDDKPTTTQDGESDAEASDQDDDNDSENSDHRPDEEADSQPSDQEPSEPTTAFSSISFGALASAQASLGHTLKRKRTPNAPTSPHARGSRSPSPFHETSERLAGKQSRPLTQRSSKHAPTEISSKRAVSRKRTVVDIPTKPQARDPRFLSLSSGPVNENAMKANYAFLDEYRASEMNELKARARKEKDAGRKEQLKKQLRAMEDRERARMKVEEERRVVSEHRKKEREQVQQGKKPFFLKRGEVKKQVLRERFEGLSEKKAERLMERRRKKMAAKERRHMPDARRSEA